MTSHTLRREGRRYFINEYTTLISSSMIPFGTSSFAEDDMESYYTGSQLLRLNGGYGWNGPYIDKNNYLSIIADDDMESYSAGSSLNGLNGSYLYKNWGGPYVSH